MPAVTRWMLIAAVVGVVAIGPIVHFRAVYAREKRLKVVEPGKVYRSGQMTADGFENAVREFGIRTVFNFQDEFPDPDLERHFLGGGTVRESELCKQLGVRYVFLPPDLLPRRAIPARRPAAIDTFLEILDDPASYPILLHCKAGMHRTGVMTAVYRMEYDGWDWRQALDELKANGFSEWQSTGANDYVMQYLLTYRRGVRRE
jgi:tyrosine-protein phosphatase SIW14